MEVQRPIDVLLDAVVSPDLTHRGELGFRLRERTFGNQTRLQWFRKTELYSGTYPTLREHWAELCGGMNGHLAKAGLFLPAGVQVLCGDSRRMVESDYRQFPVESLTWSMWPSMDVEVREAISRLGRP